MHFSRPSGCRLRTCRPCQRGAVGLFSSGYCSVLTFLNIVAKVTPKPLTGLKTSLQLVALRGSRGSLAATGHLLARRMRNGAGRQLPGQWWHGETAGERVVRLVFRPLLRRLLALGPDSDDEAEHDEDDACHCEDTAAARVGVDEVVPDGGREQQPDQARWDEDLPAELHELVITQPGQRPAQPDEHEQNEHQ